MELTGRELDHVVALLSSARTKVSWLVCCVLLLHLTFGAVVVIQHDTVQWQRRVVAERLNKESSLVFPPAG